MARGLEGIKTIRDFQFQGKNVFLRLDLNVPLKNGKVTDDTRIRASLPTIQYCLERGAKLVLASHLGRPKSGTGEDRKKYSMEPVAKCLGELLNVEVLLMQEPRSQAPKDLLPGMKRNQIILLENLRFDAGEQKNEESFTKTLASYTDIYINDAFGSSHRPDASITGIPALISEKGLGFLIEKEIAWLEKLLDKPARPYIAIMGGAKVSDKIEVIEKLMDLVDGLIIGGAMAYTFLKAQGVEVGSSLVETEKITFAKELMERMKVRGKTLLIPQDHMVTKGLEDVENIRITSSSAIDSGWMGVDIGPKTIEIYQKILKEAQTIFWNGPMGVFETPAFSKGTFAIAQTLAENKGVTVVGGGDSAAAANVSGLADKMSHISTGGGASLEYLQSGGLPGIEILRQK